MVMLTQDALARAQAFVFAEARPLERAIFAYEFEDGTIEAVWEALAVFQNPDGGLGHALEADLRLPDSSVLATTVGLQVLREYGATSAHPLVKGAMAYLVAAYDPENEVWPIIPPNADAAPHAPWWDYSEDIADGWNGFRFNPRAEIAGYLQDYADLVPHALRARVTKKLLTDLEAGVDKLEMHDVICCVRLAESKDLPEAVRRDLMARLTPIVDRKVSRDPSEWGGYVLWPLEVVGHPASPFAGLLADAVARQLDFEIARQAESGAWEPTWTWGDRHPDVWPQAKRDWSGVLTVRVLRILKRFGRITDQD